MGFVFNTTDITSWGVKEMYFYIICTAHNINGIHQFTVPSPTDSVQCTLTGMSFTQSSIKIHSPVAKHPFFYGIVSL